MTKTIKKTPDEQRMFAQYRPVASVAPTEEPTLPELPKPLYRHPQLGEMFDRMQMHSYAAKHAEGLARLLDTFQAAKPVVWQSRFISEGDTSWRPCSKEHFLLVKASPKEWPDYEVRELFDRALHLCKIQDV